MPNIFSISILSILLLSLSCNSSKVNEINGYTMGTTYSIKILNSNIPKDIIKNDIDSILNIINLEMSTYIDSSEISRFNKSIPGSQFYIGDDFYKVVSRAKVFNLLTFGLFDPTINPLVKLWGFSKNGYIDEVP